MSHLEELRRRRREEGGFFTIWTLGLCVCVLILGGVFIDLWHGFDERRQMAAMVDAAAVAGANQIDLGRYRGSGAVVLDAGEATRTARQYLLTSAEETDMDIVSEDIRTFIDNDTGELVVILQHEMDLAFTGFAIPQEDILITVEARGEPRLGSSF